jgi:tetratricopeptide (TPR) repeat protein
VSGIKHFFLTGQGEANMGLSCKSFSNAFLKQLTGKVFSLLPFIIGSGAIVAAFWLPVIAKANDLDRPDPLLQQMIIPQNSGTQSLTRNQADRLLQLGQEQMQAGSVLEAVRSWQKALQLYRQIGDSQAEALTLSYLGPTYQQLGRMSEAENAFRSQLAIARDNRSLLTQISASNSLARVLIQESDPRSAAGLLDEALILANRINSTAGQAITYTSLGILNTRLGKLDTAMRQYQEALSASRRINDTLSETTSLNGIGDIYLALRRYPTAIDYYSQALALARTNQDLFNRTHSIDGMLTAFNKTQQKEAIPPLLNERLQVAQLTQNPQQQITTLKQMAQFYQQQGNYTKADQLVQQAISVAQVSQDSQQEIQLIERLTSFRRNPSVW